MDLWVVAAATGAGYVAKYLKNLSGEKDGSSVVLSSVLSTSKQSDALNVFEKIPDPVFPIPRLAKRWLLDGDSSSGKENVSAERFQEMEQCIDNSGYFLQEYGTKKSGNYFTSISSTKSIVGGRPSMKLNSLDQLHIEHARMKEYAYPSSSPPTMRPLAVTEGLKEFSLLLREDDTSSVCACFEPIGSVKLPRRPKSCSKEHFVNGESDGQLHSQGNGMLLLFLGVAIGILSSHEVNRKEVDKLNEMLEHAETLVQDLHKELAMKDMISTKGFSNEKDKLQRLGSPESELDEYKKQDSETTDGRKGEKHKLMSEIEAELEAELEMLEMSLKEPMLERVSDFLEINQDFEMDIVRGELRPDLVDRQLDTPSIHDESENIAGNPFPAANYAVSSRDLSIRLHEVIESRLRARIEDLEIALHGSQSKPHHKESQTAHSFWDLAYSRAESSSTPESDMPGV